MALPTNADVIVVHGYWLDELTGLGVKQSNGRPATIMFDPVPLLGANATKTPNLRDLTSNAHLKTRTRVATVDPETGYYAAQLVASNDPDLDAYAGRKVTLFGEDPFIIEVPYGAPTVTVDAQMAAKTGLTQGASTKAIWLTGATVIGTPPPQPANSYLTSTQTLANIAAGIETHDEDPAAHADIRAVLATVPEQARDAVGAALVAGSGITVTVDDAANTITLTATGGGGSSYTDEQAQDAFAALVSAGTHSGISFTYNDAGNAISATVAAQSWSTRSVSTDTTAVLGELLRVDASGSARTVTPPSSPTAGAQVVVVKADSSSNAVLWQGTVNGDTGGVQLVSQWTTAVFVYDGSEWIVEATNLASIPSSGSSSSGAATWASITGKPTFAAVATSGAYTDLTGAPSLATVATSGAYTDLTAKPTLATVATSGAYTDLTAKPTLATVATSGAYTDLTGTPSLATVATSGAYTDLTAKPTIPAASYGLATRPNVPTGTRAHVAFDQYSTTITTTTFRMFMPLADPTASVVLPKFGYWLYPGTFNSNGDTDPGQPMTIAAAVEMSDGAIVPFTFNGGSHTFTFPGGVGSGAIIATPDAPRSIGAQIATTTKRSEAVSGFWLRVYVSVAAPRTDTAGITSGSSTVTDTTIASGDQGKMVTGTGIPAGTYVGTVSAGASFLLSSSPTSQVAVNATATNASASLTLGVVIPLNLGTLMNGDNLTTTTGADLTVIGSGNVSGGSGSYYYGPLTVLTRAVTQKPIVGLFSDSILDGYSEDFNSPFYGPVARACTSLGYPLVKMAKGGSTSQDWAPGVLNRYRAAFVDGITHAIVAMGTNDGIINSSANVTVLQNRLLAIGQFLVARGIKPWLSTVPPRTTSTDSWATTTNQTPVSGSQPTNLAALNAWVRTTPSPFVGYFDLASYCESSISPDSGLWAAGATIDGVHPSSALMVGSISTAISTLLSGWTV